MNKIPIIIACLLLCLANFAQTPLIDQHWGTPKWADIFSNMQINGNNWYWVLEDGTDHGWPNLFSSNNVYKDGTTGNLVLEVRHKVPAVVCTNCTHSDYNFTTGSIGSWGGNYGTPTEYGRLVQFGYIEAKIKVSDSYGLWPAFWTWSQIGNSPTDGNWDYDEIDIFEMIPGSKDNCILSPFYNQVHNKNIMTTNLHNNMNGGEKGCTGLEDDRGLTLSIDDYTQWHKYAVEWSPSKIIFYVDDKVIRNSLNPGFPCLSGTITQPTSIILGNGLNPYVAWPSEYYGSPNNGSDNYFSQTIFPAKMEVEYVKYYTLNTSDCFSVNLTITSNNLNSYDNKVKKRIITNGVISISSPTTWRASDYILINGDFTVPLGSELYLDVNPCSN